MKALIHTCLFLICILQLNAQGIDPIPSHKGITFQGVARDAEGKPILEKEIKIKAELIDANGKTAYGETHSPPTDKFGLFSVAIGEGTVTTGDFYELNWTRDFSYRLSISIDPTGGNNFTLVGITTLKSVPYAKYASKAGNAYWEKDNSGNLNYPNGNVGINAVTDKAPFATSNDYTTQAIFGLNTPGVSLQHNWPGIGLNHYYYNGQKSLGKGYGGYIGVDPDNGNMFIRTTSYASQPNDPVYFTDRLFISQNGFVGIGHTAPEATLDVSVRSIGISTALFRGSRYHSSFNTGAGEHTYIRGGYDASYVYINDKNIGNVSMVKDGGKVYIGTGESAEDPTLVVGRNGNKAIAEFRGSYYSSYFGTYSPYENTFIRAGAPEGKVYINDNNVGDVYVVPDGARAGIGTKQLQNATLTIDKSSSNNALSVIGNSDFKGNINLTGTMTNPSDIRYKEKIKPISSSLAKVLRLQGVSYYYKTSVYPSKNFNKNIQIGFIAQEVKNVIPELVSEDQEGYLSVDYSKVTPLLVEAMKEQNSIIEKQQKEIDELKAQLQELIDLQKASLK